MALPREARLAIARFKAGRVACVVCGTFEDIVRHHVHGRRVSHKLVPMCKPCESAVHGRSREKQGTTARVLHYRSLLPEWCIQKPLGTRPYGVSMREWKQRHRAPQTMEQRAGRPRTVRDALAEAQPEVLVWLESMVAE